MQLMQTMAREVIFLIWLIGFIVCCSFYADGHSSPFTPVPSCFKAKGQASVMPEPEPTAVPQPEQAKSTVAASTNKTATGKANSLSTNSQMKCFVFFGSLMAMLLKVLYV